MEQNPVTVSTTKPLRSLKKHSKSFSVKQILIIPKPVAKNINENET